MLLGISVLIMVCLSLVLVVILFKLYQTYQPVQSSPCQASNNSFTSLDTQMSSFHSQVELLPVFTTGLVYTNHNGGEQEGIVKKSQTCDRSVTRSSNLDKLDSRENLKSVWGSKSNGIVKSDFCGCLEQTGKIGSIPHFHEKWQFPKCVNDPQHQKYLSL